MTKVVPVLLLAALLAVAWLMFVHEDDEGGWQPDDDYYGQEGEGDPRLLGAEGAGPRPARPTKRPAGKSAAELEAEAFDRSKTLYLKGVVLAQEGGGAIPGARLWVEPAREPCPRMPDHEHRHAPLLNPEAKGAGVPPPWPSFHTDKNGRFEWRAADWELKSLARDGVDLFVEAKGYVTGLLCRPTRGGDVTIRLVKALQLPVHVTDRHRRPVKGAVVRVRPAELTEQIPGHSGLAVTDEQGRCEIDGLLPGAIVVTADHPVYMPAESPPIDPAQVDAVDLELAPALRLTFEIRSDDGSDVRNPLLRWDTDGKPPHSGLQLLDVEGSGPPAQPLAEVRSRPVRIPCDHDNVNLELKADGFDPWRPQAEPLPPEGGTRKIIASLTRNTSHSPLTVHFQDEGGKTISFREMRAKLDPPRHLDGKDVGAITYETAETLHFPRLTAGRYEFGVRSPNWAPVRFEVDVREGEKNETTVKLTRPARLRIRFLSDSPERLTVRFRVVHAGRPAHGFPLKPDGSPAPDTGTITGSGQGGALFGGLPTGSCTIEVISPELVATSQTVLLSADETTEVEMEVRRR